MGIGARAETRPSMTRSIARCSERGRLVAQHDQHLLGRLRAGWYASGLWSSEAVTVQDAAEVEAVLQAHPWVEQAAVLAVPDEVRVERPRSREHGDWATNVALQVAKDAGLDVTKLKADMADPAIAAILTTAAGVPVKIGDVATVQLGTATRYGAVCYNDRGETAGAVVMMLKGENSSAVIGRVKERIAEIRKLLPEGVVIEPFLDRTKMVNNAIGTVETNLMEGALIVVFVLVLFLGNLRAGLVVASVIPLAMLFAVILMNMFGVSGNLMSLGALDFGLIVDGAVIIVEAVMHQLSHSKTLPHTEASRLTQRQMDQQVEKSAARMMNAAVFGQIIILVVYLPIFALEGIEGKMFRPMAQTVAFALLGAFLLSLTYVPAISALSLGKKASLKVTFSDRVMSGLERFFQGSLSRVLQFPKTAMAAAGAIFLAALFVLSTLGGEFIPELEEGDFAVDTRVLTGSNLGTTIASTQQSAGILLRRFPEVEKIVTKIGSGEIPTDPMPIEASDMMVILKDKKEWTSARTFDELAAKMSTALQDVPGVTAGFQFPVQMRFNELMTGAKQDVVCKIFGENLDTLAVLAGRLGEIAGQVEGATEVYVEAVTGMPQIVVRHRRAALAQYGLSVETVNRTVNAAFAGAFAGQVFEEEKRFDLVVRLDRTQRRDLADVQNLPIATPGGAQIPLGHVADVQIVEGPSQIQRENAQRRIIVGFNARGRDVQSLVDDLRVRVASGLAFPAGYSITYGGSFENLQAAKARLGVAVPVSLLLIFLMLYFAFGSIRQGLLIFTAIPLSAVGGILALALRGMPFSISAGIGFIALFGVAVLNGIVLITEFNRLFGEGITDLRRVVLQGTKIRLRPVLMTASVASLGFLPMAFSHGAGAEVQRPLATVVIGGLLSATLLTLFLLPVLYVFFGKKARPVTSVAAVTALVLLSGGPQAAAQTPVSVQAAVDSALQHHPSLRPYALGIAQNRTLEATARDLPKTDFNLESGQINTACWDNRLGVSQTFAAGRVVAARAGVLAQNTAVSEAGQALQRREVAFEVKTLYAEIVALQQTEATLQRADSLYAAAAGRAAARLNAGESNALEKASAELHRSQANRKLKAAQAEREILLERFRRLLGTAQAVTPQAVRFEPAPAVPAMAPDHPVLGLAQSHLGLAERNISLARAALLPDFRLGLALQSIRGPQTIGGAELTYGSAPRFFTLQAGMSLPVFKKAANARVQAAVIGRDAARAAEEAARFSLEIQYRSAALRLEKCRAALGDFEKNTLPAAETLLKTADRQLRTGEINYLEWTVHVSQALSARLEYAELLRQYNLAAVALDYFAP